MAEVKKARLFLRRGTDTDRKTTVLCDGELGYSTDAFRVVIGDGATTGGRSVGTTVHVSGGALSHNFHTKLTEASAFDGTGGFADRGDIAVFPAASYTNAKSETVNPERYASTVMVLTADVGAEGTSPNADEATSWVAVNSGIPWGNITVLDNDISGDKIHGGTISGDLTLSDDLTALSAVTLPHIKAKAENATALDTASKIWPLGITGTSVLTAVSSTQSFSNVAGGAGNNFYWDDYAATSGSSTVANALSRAINATGSAGHSNTNIGDMMYIRFQWTRTVSGGNGSGESAIRTVIGFLKTSVGSAVSNWTQVSQVLHGNQNAYDTAGTTVAKWPL